MTKRQTHPKNGPETSAAERRQGEEEHAPAQPASASSGHLAEAEEAAQRKANEPSSEEDDGATRLKYALVR